MVRRIAVIGVAVAALLLFTMGPAMADRLGGAYRGPYKDKVTKKDDLNTEVGGAVSGSAPTGGGESGGGTGGGETGGGESAGGGAATQPPGEGEGGGEGEGEGGGAATEPPGSNEGEGGEGEGGGTSTEPGAPPPSGGEGGGSEGGGSAPPPSGNPGSPGSPGIGGGGGGGAGPGTAGGGKLAQEDVYAYWPFWFEHNKEWILAELLKARGARARVPQQSSTWFFMGGSGRNRTPVSEEQKTKLVFPLLVESSRDPSSFVRDAAVLALGKLGTPESVAPIVARLEDPKEQDQDIKEDALLALGLTRQKDALKPLMARLNDRRLRPFAALGLGLLGMSEAVPVLLKHYKVQIRARNADAAGCIAVALGLLGDEEIVDELAAPIGMARGGIDGLNLYVCQALGRIGGDKAQKWLLRALKSRSSEVQAAAVLALSSYSDKTVVNYLLGRDGLKAGDRMAKVFAAVALGRIAANFEPKDPVRKKVRGALRDVAENPGKDKYAAMFASLAMAIMGESASNKFFEENLDTGNRPKYSTENYSAMALSSGLLENKKTIRFLRDILTKGSYEPDFRGYAAFALGIMGDLESKDAIKEGIERNKRKQELVRSGCWALGLLGDRDDLDLLISLLKKEVNNLHQARGAAAVASGLVGDGSAVEKLMKIVNDDKDTSNRAFAVVALGCLIDAEPVPRIPQLFMNVHYREESRLVRDVLTNL